MIHYILSIIAGIGFGVFAYRCWQAYRAWRSWEKNK